MIHVNLTVNEWKVALILGWVPVTVVGTLAFLIVRDVVRKRRAQRREDDESRRQFAAGLTSPSTGRFDKLKAQSPPRGSGRPNQDGRKSRE
jgi:flagellar biosynthesis/type III secretory pathway M-ring protein FliF/YscJ